ncbi:hypothetical protein BUALT_Bualt01G0096700 [Buddleja alternifolia]|uniref:Uncharacterized protein n=1 Tax=Buddleja alternifolia TaxID=168488 RepID=A0AAV6YGA9_9LAMI|nr:hypothetical protein BUALT_Bualt01G0096700 [Buddleja alternifolia]
MDVVKPAKHEHVGESSNSGNSDYLNYLLDEPFMDSSDNLQFGDEGFIEANDLSNPVETNNSAIDMLEEYLSFFDANDDEYFTNDPMAMLGSEDLVQNQALILQNELERGTEQAILPIGQFINNHNNDAKSQSDKQEATKTQEDSQYPFIKRASQMLGSIPAPSAFAAEFPPKDAIVRLNSVPQSPSSVHVTAGVIQIGNLNMGGNGAELSSGKHENFNIVLSFGFQRGDDGSASLESRVNVTVPTISRSWFYFLFLWVFIFSMSFKIGTYVCAN